MLPARHDDDDEDFKSFQNLLHEVEIRKDISNKREPVDFVSLSPMDEADQVYVWPHTKVII